MYICIYIYIYIYTFLLFFLIVKCTLEVALQYLFKAIKLLKTIFYLKLHFTVKVDPKRCTFENLEQIQKTLKIFSKTFGSLKFYIGFL